MSTRLEFSKKTKLAAFQRSDGNCEGCGAKLLTGRIEYDHQIPAAMGGDNSLGNLTVLCYTCHAIKTRKQDIPRIAKSNRQRAKHIGIKRRSSFQTNRDGLYRKRMDGTVERR